MLVNILKQLFQLFTKIQILICSMFRIYILSHVNVSLDNVDKF